MAAKFNYIQNNFAAGELSDKLDGRTDLPQYKAGAKVLENAFTLRQGGATRRPGFRYISDINQTGKIFPFVFSKTQAYLIAIDPSQTVVADRIKAIDRDGTQTSIGSNLILNTSLDVDAFQYVQSGDLIFFVHPETQPFVVFRYGSVTSPTFNAQTYWDQALGFAAGGIEASNNVDGLATPYRDSNIGSTTITPSATTGAGITLTASANLFTSGHVGSYWKIEHGAATTGIVKIVGYTSPTSVTANVIVSLGATTATDNWQEGAWSNERGYPRAVTIFENRLIFGGNEAQPNTLWASLQYNLFFMMERRLAQDDGVEPAPSGTLYGGDPNVADPFQFSIASQQVNQIQWLSAKRTLQVGTLGSEYTVRGGEETALSSANVQVTPQTAHGSSEVQPVQIGNTTIFVSRDGQLLREFQFNLDNDAYVATNISLLSTDIIKHKFVSGQFNGIEVKEMVYQESRAIIWIRTSRDALIALTIDAGANILAWHKHDIGGEDAKVISISIIPNEDGSFDDLWAIVERTINGTTKHYLEKMGDSFEHPNLSNISTNEDDKPWFMDSAVRYTLETFNSGALLETLNTTNTGTDILTITDGVSTFIDGDAVRFYGSGTLPVPLLFNKTYYINVQSGVTPKDVKIYETRADALADTNSIDITAVHSGSITLAKLTKNWTTGFAHLEGETVQVLADGFTHPDVVISSGGITLDKISHEVVVGLQYITTIETMRLEAGLFLESSQAQIKRIDQVTVRLFESYGVEIGEPSKDLVPIKFREASSNFGSSLPLFTGDKNIKFNAGPDREARVKIQQVNPLPLNVTALILRGQTYD